MGRGKGEPVGGRIRRRPCFPSPGILLIPLLLLTVDSAREANEALLERVAPLAEEPVTRGNEVELLVGGPEFFPERLSLIENARESIGLFTYLWCPDRAGTRIAEALAAASERGVRVRVAVDFFNRKDPAAVYDLLEQAGVELMVFNPPRWRWRLQERMHEKMMVVDGESVLVGGANLCEEYMLEDAGRGLWQDFELLVGGPAAARAQARFDEAWSRMSDTEANQISPSGSSVFDSISTRPREPADAGGAPAHDGHGSAAESAYLSALRAPVHEPPGAGEQGAAVLLHYQQPYVRDGESERSLALYCRLFDSARRRIVVYAPYMVPPPAFKDALVAAARRGVEVRIFTNSAASTDLPRVCSVAAQVRYRRLLEAGVRIFESPRPTLHGKAIVVDDLVAAVGSHNFTTRSFLHNGECKLITSDTSVIRRLLQVCDRHAELYDEITLTDLDRSEPRGVLSWIGRGAGRLF